MPLKFNEELQKLWEAQKLMGNILLASKEMSALFFLSSIGLREENSNFLKKTTLLLAVSKSYNFKKAMIM